jgi:PAS domain S-box-containing protein
MRLFYKTLLFFVGVIAFQSALTILLVSGLTRRSSLAEARRELADEAAIIYESFNSWKRQMWASLIGIGNDRRLARSLDPSAATSPRLQEAILVAKVDCLILKRPGAQILEVLPSGYLTFTAADLGALQRVKPHPYLELRILHGTLCLVGVTLIPLSGSRHLEAYLIKRLDQEFCAQLTLNRKSRVVLLLGQRELAASGPPPAPAFDPRAMPSSYLERYNQRLGGERLNLAFQRIGRLEQQEQGEELFLGTFLSNEPYNRRILQAGQGVLLISAAGALATCLLSLYLSRNITHPIASLLSAMQRLKAGAYDTRVGTRGGYEIRRLFGGFNDMAEKLAGSRAALQDNLQETLLLKEYNEKIINSIRAGIAIVDRDLRVEKANRAFQGCFGLDGREVLGARLESLGIDLVDAPLLERIRSILSGQQDSFAEVKRSAGGRVFELKLYPFFSPGAGHPQASGCILMAEDVSAKTELEQKIFQAEKLSSISMLSAGMAHEINNPLSSILTNVQNLLEEEPGSARRVSLKWIEQETRRIARLVQELLNFASAGSPQPGGCALNPVVEQTVGLLSRSLPEGIRIDTRLAADLPPSAASADELKQVVLNLVKNSIQAIDGQGRILVRTCLDRRDGGLSLVVSDTGRGMPRELIPRIFDPFFTTKDGGTGLGLSVVYGIVTKYGGALTVRSREGRGTRIALSLPSPGGQEELS